MKEQVSSSQTQTCLAEARVFALEQQLEEEREGRRQEEKGRGEAEVAGQQLRRKAEALGEQVANPASANHTTPATATLATPATLAPSGSSGRAETASSPRWRRG